MAAFDEVPALDRAMRDTSSVVWDMFQVFSVTIRIRSLGFALRPADERPIPIRVANGCFAFFWVRRQRRFQFAPLVDLGTKRE